jgi:5-methylcytosine-specific restriction endonuclease McrA
LSIFEEKTCDKLACHYCNSKFTNDNLKEIDHIVPVSSNGTHCMSNIVIACSHCNRSKNRMDLEKWLFICEKASRLNLENVSKAAYKSLNESFDGCKICNSKLETNHILKKYCNECSVIKRKLISSLTSTRKGKPNKFPLSEIVKIISCWKSAKSCIYCNRNFSDLIYKSPDHIIPINLGGENVASNINICCFECNLAKGRISLADWINLSKLISANLKNILLNKE